MYTKPMPLNRKLVENVPVQYDHALKVPDLYGVEVELEGNKIKTQRPDVHKFWAQHPDNSLRVKKETDEAIEYVLRQPYTYDETLGAVANLFNYLNSPGVEVYKSYRTSIHVHLSCVMETHRTIYNFMTLCIIFDELLTSQNGRHRAGNNFCLRTKDAQGQVQDIIHSIDHNGTFLGIDHNKRYSSINFVSLLKYGTIEFRSLECTTDFERMKHWMDTLTRLKDAARKFENPQAIIRQFSLMSLPEFLHSVLGPCASKYIVVKDWQYMLQRGMRLAQDLAYSSSWVAMKVGEAEPKPAPKPRKPKLDQYVGYDNAGVLPPAHDPQHAPVGWAQQYMAQAAQAQGAQAAQAQAVPQPGGHADLFPWDN